MPAHRGAVDRAGPMPCLGYPLAVRRLLLAPLLAALACGGSLLPRVPPQPPVDPCANVSCSTHASCQGGACLCHPGYTGPATACVASTSPSLGGCAIFPADHVFNTPIDGFPVHASSAALLARIGDRRLHLDLGQDANPASATYYGIPYNVAPGGSIAWTAVAFGSPGWDARAESDCGVATSGGHAVVSPCTAAAAPAPVFPLPALPLVEGGLPTSEAAGGDHHLLVVDSDACRLWELYHAWRSGSGWGSWGAASWDLSTSALRPDGWTSADAAGFPILPLLLRADEASSGAIRHALRFTLPATRNTHVWPARHMASSSSAADLPPMGQLFRLKSSYVIPASYSTQSKAILRALQRYGMYLADNGSALYVQGEPSAAWSDTIFGEVQSVRTGDFEAVDLSSVAARPGFDPDSARVPPP